jgi:hypothetical protein
MKYAFIFLGTFMMFVLLASGLTLAQDQRDIRTINIKSSEVTNGVVILAARDAKSSFELQCNKDFSGCAVLNPGTYSMIRLPKNHGAYECANVEVYPTTGNAAAADKLGEYCLVEEK